MSLFPIEPLGPPPVAGQQRTTGPKNVLNRRLVLGVAAAGLALAGVKGWQMTTAADTTGELSAASAPPMRSLAAAACIDASGSVIKTDNSPRRTLETLHSALIGWPMVDGPVKMSVASEAQAPMRLAVRLVEDNSYLTDAKTSLVDVRIPAYPGVSGKLPATDSPDYAVEFATYKTEVAAAEEARRAQDAAVNQAADNIQALTTRRSTGSDVLGCVAAVTETTKPQTILIVSDLADTRLKEPNGKPRAFPGSLKGTSVLVLQACPSGSPEKCSAAAAAFTTGLTQMGLDTNHLSIVRAEEAPDQTAAWMNTLREASHQPAT